MKPVVVVIGTIFIDCKGFAGNRYNPAGRNLGEIKFVHGGVGRNVAENLSLLNLPVQFVSTVDSSALGTEVVLRLRAAGVNLDYLAQAQKKGMGMWLAVLDQNGDLAGSISLEMAKFLSKKVYGIPGNLEVILKNKDLLRHTECFICNDIEAGRLLEKDLAVMEPERLLNELAVFVGKEGPPAMVVTMGERGAVYFDSRTEEKGYQQAFKTRVVDSSGAGDAFFSGTVMGLIKGRPLSEAVVYGAKVASWTIQVNENICPDISVKLKGEKFNI